MPRNDRQFPGGWTPDMVPMEPCSTWLSHDGSHGCRGPGHHNGPEVDMQGYAVYCTRAHGHEGPHSTNRNERGGVRWGGPLQWAYTDLSWAFNPMLTRIRNFTRTMFRAGDYVALTMRINGEERQLPSCEITEVEDTVLTVVDRMAGGVYRCRLEDYIDIVPGQRVVAWPAG